MKPHAIFISVLMLLSSQILSCKEISYKVEHLFTLHAEDVIVSYEERPTPSIAVNSEGFIAFPIRPYTIGIYSPDGNCIRTIIDSSNTYPREMLFDDNDVLQVLSYDEMRVIKYLDDGKIDLPLDHLIDWWKYSDARIAEYLKHEVTLSSKMTKGILSIFMRFPYYIVILARENKLYIDSDKLVIHDLANDSDQIIHDIEYSLFGIINERHLLVRDIANLAYLAKIDEKAWVKIDTRTAEIKDRLPNSIAGNAPESNKLNIAKNWYWQRNSNNAFRVLHAPTGFYIFKVTFYEVD